MGRFPKSRRDMIEEMYRRQRERERQEQERIDEFRGRRGRGGVISPREYPGRVQAVYDAISEEPRTTNEVIRHTGLSPRVVCEILYSLQERGQLDFHIIDSRMMEAWPTITPAKWEQYHVWFNKNSEGKLDWKKHRVRNISWVGSESARMMEEALKAAAYRVWGYERVVATPFDSKLPDAYVPSLKIAIEISVKWENPVDEKYIRTKIDNLPTTKADKPNWTLIIFSPKLELSARDFLHEVAVDRAAEGGHFPTIHYYEFPEQTKRTSGFPIFLQYREYFEIFQSVAREAKLVGYWDTVDRLEELLRQHQGG